MNKKGQALVEFVLILPVFLFLALSTIDFGNILYQKNLLESDLDFVINLYESEQSQLIDNYVTSRKLKISYEKIDNYQNIKLSKNINITTPGLNLILGNPYNISTTRFIYE